MKNVLLMLALVGLLAAPAYADIVKNYDLSTAALVSPAGTVTPRALPYTVGFEAGEGFAPGYLGGQAGWTTFAASVAQPTVATAHPYAGAQHVRIANDSAVGAGTLTGGFSPLQGTLGVGHYITSMAVSVSASGGANYGVVVQAPSQGFLSARLEFDWLGTIIVLDDPGTGLGWVDTGVAWTPGVYKNLTIDLDSVTNSLKYYYDGSLFYTGVAGVYAGTSAEQVIMYSDNYQNPGETGDFDAVSITPEPATLALLGFGALALIRRR
jgi:hypothetical protein